MTLAKEVELQRVIRDRDYAKAVRERAGVSRAEIASELNVTAFTVHRWETGTRTPRGSLRSKYARLIHALDRATSH